VLTKARPEPVPDQIRQRCVAVCGITSASMARTSSPERDRRGIHRSAFGQEEGPRGGHERDNKAHGPAKGRTVHWNSALARESRGKMKRLEALRKVTRTIASRRIRPRRPRTPSPRSERRWAPGESLAPLSTTRSEKVALFASGDEHERDGSRDLKTVVQDVGKTLVGISTRGSSRSTSATTPQRRQDPQSGREEGSHFEAGTEPLRLAGDATAGAGRRSRPLLEAIKDLEDETN